MGTFNDPWIFLGRQNRLVYGFCFGTLFFFPRPLADIPMTVDTPSPIGPSLCSSLMVIPWSEFGHQNLHGRRCLLKLVGHE